MTARGGEQRIYINGRFLDQRMSGVQRYAREIASAVDRQLRDEPSGAERWFLLTTGATWDGPPLERMEVRPVRSVLRGHFWEQLALARAARDGVLIGLAGSGPLSHARQLVVIHDASVFRNPDYFAAAYGSFHRFLGRALSRRARIGTVSAFSRDELADVLGLDPGRMALFGNGSDHVRDTTPADRFEQPARPYFVLLGNRTKNKNIAVAVGALEHVPNARLLIVGGADERVFGGSAANVATDRVEFAGRLDDGVVARLLQNAEALLFPSLYEGFGLPPIEAMAHNCPVIASDIPAVREICGDAALLFDPRDPLALAARMRQVMAEDPEARQRRRDTGVARAARFTWESTARSLIAFVRSELLPTVRSR